MVYAAVTFLLISLMLTLFATGGISGTAALTSHAGAFVFLILAFLCLLATRYRGDRASQ